MHPTTDTCAHLRNPNPYTVFLAAFILAGILVSYLPQHHKIISRRSADGLSPWWVLLGGLSSVFALANILVLPASRADITCCKEVKGGECAAALLGVGQIGLQWGCFMFIVTLFLIFTPPTSPPSTTDPTALTASATLTPTSPPSTRRRRDALIVASTTLLTVLLVALISSIILLTYPTPTAQAWANILGTLAGGLAMIQYLPQIYTTWTLGSIQSLSVLTMLIQVPGSFLFAFSLWLRVGWEGWSAWVVFVVTGTLQGGLLALAIGYWVAGRKNGEEDGGQEGAGAVDERTALLSNGQVRNKVDRLARRDGGEEGEGS